MLTLLELVTFEVVAVTAPFFPILGVPDLPRFRRKRVITVRQGGEKVLITL